MRALCVSAGRFPALLLVCGMYVGALEAAEWNGEGSNSLFNNPGNWNGGVPDASQSAYFGRSAGVEFGRSEMVSSLTLGGNTAVSFLLNGRTFQSGQSSVGGSASLLVSGGIASLGTLNLDGGLFLSGAGTVLTAQSVQGYGRLIQVNEGAGLQVDSLSSLGSGFVLQVNRGGAASIGGLGIQSGQSLNVSGAGSVLGSNGLSLSGVASITNGGTISLQDLNLNGVLSVAGAGSSVQVANYYGGSSGVISVLDGGVVSLGGSSNTASTASLMIFGAGSQLTNFGSLRVQNVGVQDQGRFSVQNQLEVQGNLGVTGGRLSAEFNVTVRGTLDVSQGGTAQFQTLYFTENGSRLAATGPGTSVAVRSLNSNRVNVSVSAGAAVNINSLSNELGSLSISGTGSSLTVGDSSVVVLGSTQMEQGTSLSLLRSLSLYGSSVIHGAVVTASAVSNYGTLEIRDTQIGYAQGQGDGYNLSNGNGATLSGSFTTNYHLNNYGMVRVVSGETMSFRSGTNSGVVAVEGGKLEFWGGSVSNTGTLLLSGDLRGEGGIHNHRTVEITGDANIAGDDFRNAAGASVAILTASTARFMDDVVNDGVIAIGTDSTAVFYGSFSGSGTIVGPGTTMMLGDLRPGHSPGAVQVEGNLIFGENFVYEVEIGGNQPGMTYDQVQVGGRLSLDGTIRFAFIDGYHAQVGESFEILNFGSKEGDFVAYEGLALGDGLFLSPEWTQSALLLTVVPEPKSLGLVMAALIALLAYRNRRKFYEKVS